MGLKGQKTKSDHLTWERFQLLLHQLERDQEIRMLLLFATGTYCALRVGDVLSIKWEEVFEKDTLEIVEQKTKKHRTIDIHDDLKRLYRTYYNDEDLDSCIFSGNSKKGQLSLQHVNREIKRITKKYELRGRFSSHNWRKTLGRRVWEQYGCTERALLLLSELFGHSSLQITRIYLNIKEKEIRDIYLGL